MTKHEQELKVYGALLDRVLAIQDARQLIDDALDMRMPRHQIKTAVWGISEVPSDMVEDLIIEREIMH